MDTLTMRESLVQKIENSAALFNELFEKDPNGMIISYEKRAELKELQRRNANVLHKLKSREFSVAVVGLEKAGKSTLGNALIRAIVLPEYTERCTFTTTEIRAGSEDEAEIHFYSREEFNTDFKKMLGAIGYHGNADFESMDLDTFNRYWAAVEGDEEKRSLFDLHNGTTVEDIRTILKNKGEIAPLLSRSPMKFVGQDEWRSREFQLYITGMKGKSAEGSVIRGAHPYAVKNVIIRSTGLGSMEHMALYDVPGFDSPTDLHKKQTEKMLAAADAIILVTNVGDRPNLVGTQLDMLRKVRDDDGIRLNEKAFVFGNKIDRAGTSERANGNKAALLNDAVQKYQVAPQDRVVFGSAKAYLESHNLFSRDDEERGLTGADRTLAEWGMSDGIDDLHEKMQAYYDTDRLAVLKARAEKTLADTEKTLHDILDAYTPDVIDRLETGGDLLLAIKDRVDTFVKKANTLSLKHQNDIARSKPFTNALNEQIAAIYPLSADFPDLIEDVENERVIDIDGNYPLTAVDSSLREKLQLKFLNNLVETTATITGNRQKEIRGELVDLFLETLGMPKDSVYKDELNAAANELFDECLQNNPGAKCIFNSLVERFALNPIETLILAPFATHDRYDKVRRSLPELFSLSVYYSITTTEAGGDAKSEGKTEEAAVSYPRVEDNPEDRFSLFAKILAHEGTESENTDASPNEISLQKLFEENKQAIEGVGFALSMLPCARWANILRKGGFVLSKLPPNAHRDFVRSFEDLVYKNSWKRMTAEDRMNALEEFMGDVVKTKKQPTAGSLGDKLAELKEQGKAIASKDDMIATLDADIAILREITASAVLKAIGLERAFISVVVKNINLIRNSLSESPAGRQRFNAWINKNVRKIKDSEFARIDQDNMNMETRRTIVNSIRQVLDKMEG